MSNITPELFTLLLLIFCAGVVGAGLASAISRAFWD
jgi:Na+-driven multidrug efflux pump